MSTEPAKRIVLLDNWGEELFSGVSLSSLPPAPIATLVDDADAISVRVDEDNDEEPPPTLRSSVFLRQQSHERALQISEVEPETLRRASESGVMPAVREVREVVLNTNSDDDPVDTNRAA